MTAALYGTIWAALILFVAAEAGRTRFARTPDPASWAWPAMMLGACLMTAHVIIALGLQYGWDHELAVSETAKQAAKVYGFEWRGNIYVSYGFVILWLVEAWRWKARPQVASRPQMMTWIYRAFFFVIIANGAIVFATTPLSRAVGMLVVAALVWAWWPPFAQREHGAPLAYR